MVIFAKVVMTLSLAYYALTHGYVWLGQLLSFHNEIWEVFDFPEQAESPPVWALIVGLVMSLCAISSLAISYRGAWSILNGGSSQDFRVLQGNMRHMAWGLIGFWIGWNLITGVMQHLIVINLKSTDGFDFGWDPFDLDIVFAITGIVLLAISTTLKRAWLAEDENKHFL